MTSPFEAVAVDAATRAGALLRRHHGGPRQIGYKGSPNNLVTEMDRRAEALIVDAIRARFPDHAILAEERGAEGTAAASHRWIVDPLDGTTNYAHGFPIYAVSIALEIEGALALGVVYDPNRDECFVAERGRGATLGGQPIRVSATAKLADSLLGTGYQYDIRSGRNNLAEHGALLLRSHSVREIGSAVLHLASVAAGRLDAFWELSLGAWDVAAGALLVEEAGGTVTSARGGPLDLSAPSILASNGLIHDEVLQVLEEAGDR